jgi:ABC transporter substrate binding protein
MRFDQLKRRDFVTLIGGGAAAWPRGPTARISAPEGRGPRRGENVAIVYRWAEGQLDRLQALAAELVGRRDSVLAAFSHTAAFAAKAAITTIPIVFLVGTDPVWPGLVASLARPGGNLTGISFLSLDRRGFMTLLSGAAAWPLAARARCVGSLTGNRRMQWQL